jgi:hypothetical protein
MAAIVTSNFRVLNANNFKEDVANSSVYVAIGKSDVWSLTTSDTTDTTPFTPNDHLDDLGEARENLIGMKKIASSDLSHVVDRYTWTSNTVYDEWDSNDPSIFDKKFYVITSEFKVYKCIKAPINVGSTIQPTHTLTNPQLESDGYTWKYMFTVAVADAEKFLTNSYMPVKTVSLGSEGVVAASSAATTVVLTDSNPDITAGMAINGGSITIGAVNGNTLTTSGNITVSADDILTFAFASDAAAEASLTEADFAQYLNQKASRDSLTAAGIERFEITAAGSGYTDGTHTFASGSSGTRFVTITGDGTGAEATATVSGGIITAINVTNKGTNYTVADIAISGQGGADATARAVLAPKGGHGVDPRAELGGFFLSLNVQLVGATDVDLTTGNDFRQITLIKEPRLYNAVPFAGAISSADTLKALNSLDLTASGGSFPAFVVDELIVGQTSTAQAYVVEIDADEGYLYYHQNSKTGYTPFAHDEVIQGQTSQVSGTIESSGNSGLRNPEVDRASGQILFLENRDPINRTTTQIEDIKVILEF